MQRRAFLLALLAAPAAGWAVLRPRAAPALLAYDGPFAVMEETWRQVPDRHAYVHSVSFRGQVLVSDIVPARDAPSFTGGFLDEQLRQGWADMARTFERVYPRQPWWRRLGWRRRVA